jgi:hypothetical protein
VRESPPRVGDGHPAVGGFQPAPSVVLWCRRHSGPADSDQPGGGGQIDPEADLVLRASARLGRASEFADADSAGLQHGEGRVPAELGEVGDGLDRVRDGVRHLPPHVAVIRRTGSGARKAVGDVRVVVLAP